MEMCYAVKAGKDLHPPPEFHPQTSEYPVILSLENHCSVEQQQVMAKYMTAILGPALLTQPLGDTMPTCFPSPEVSVGLDYTYSSEVRLKTRETWGSFM